MDVWICITTEMCFDEDDCFGNYDVEAVFLEKYKADLQQISTGCDVIRSHIDVTDEFEAEILKAVLANYGKGSTMEVEHA